MTDRRTPVAVDGVLARYARIARFACEEYLPREGSLAYLVHPAADYVGRPGKGIRAALCFAACEAFGGDEDDARPSAAAIELMHNAFLVHDDVQDASTRRRGGPTLHEIHGIPLAINAGDALMVSSLRALRNNTKTLGARLGDLVVSEFEFMAQQTVDGQALELGWRKDNRLDLEPADYVDLIMKKTCWYTTVLPLRVGALIGSRGAADVEPMIGFGFSLGAAFQIRDDVLNVSGDPEAHGKEPYGDVYEGKRTLVLVHLLTVADSADRRWLAEFLGRTRDDRSAADVDRVVAMMAAYGSIAFAKEFAKGIAGTAREDFDAAFAGVPPSDARSFVEGMIPYMIERSW